MRRTGRRGATAMTFALAIAITPCAGATGADAATASRPAPSFGEALASVGDLSHELKLIHQRLVEVERTLGSIDRSVAGIRGSLEPVGVLARPDGMQAAAGSVAAVAYDRARDLVLLATGCAAGLLVLHALLRRWTARRDAH